MKKARRVVLWFFGGLLVLCIAAAAVSAVSNRFLPAGPQVLDRLDVLDKARLSESLHLKQTLGDAVWPGLGQTSIPVLVWNHETMFLVEMSDPPPPWEIVPDDDFEGQVYYRAPNINVQNFATQVGDRWVAAMGTKSETDAFLIATFRDMFPPVIKQVFPYRIMIQPSETQITAVLHEAFHVLQTETAGERLRAAEHAHRLGDAYSQAADAMQPAWSTELGYLISALKAKSDDEARQFVRQFLAQRDQRREENNLSPELVEYERWLEWEEGIAKYVEVSSWKAAATAEDYTPEPALAADPDFKEYATFDSHWSQLLIEIRTSLSGDNETRFYSAGMAQAFLLDRLMPGWKDTVFQDGVWIEDLLRQAVKE